LCLSISLECEPQYPNYFYIDNSDQNSVDALKKIQEIKKVNHENVFANFSAVEGYTHTHVSYPITDDKNLVQYLRSKSGQLKEAEVSGLIGQLLKGYELLYNKDMYHGNIQPKTLIMEGEVLKLHVLSRPTEFKLQDFPMDKNYIASKSLSAKKYHKAADIWSIGIITYYMLHEKPPFDVNKANPYPEEYIVNASLSQLCMDFLSCCLQVDPKNRMSFKEIKSHPFVTNVTKGWELVKPNPYSKSKWLISSEYKCNIKKLIRGIVKAKVKPSREFCIEERGKGVKLGTYYESTHRCNWHNQDPKIRKFSL